MKIRFFSIPPAYTRRIESVQYFGMILLQGIDYQ